MMLVGNFPPCLARKGSRRGANAGQEETNGEPRIKARGVGNPARSFADVSRG